MCGSTCKRARSSPDFSLDVIFLHFGSGPTLLVPIPILRRSTSARLLEIREPWLIFIAAAEATPALLSINASDFSLRAAALKRQRLFRRS
jgi:hypothetical protein